MNKDITSQIYIYSICTISFLPKALVLAESVFQFEKRKIVIYLIDPKADIYLNYEYAEFKWIEDEDIPNFKKLAFTYNVTEFCTLFKPLLGLNLIKKYSRVIYLDPDLCLYNSLSYIHKTLDKYPIIVTPHYTTPRQDNKDLDMMRFGMFNMGFYAVTNNIESINFLSWWSDRCLNLGFDESQFGLSTDQKWVSIAPIFFPNLHIEFNLGLNVAYWNLHERTITKESGIYFVNNNAPLVFFHFSSFNIKNPQEISTRFQNYCSPHKKEIINELLIDYANRIKLYDKNYSSIKYGYDYMSNGDYISFTLRRAFASVADKIDPKINPFDSDGVMRKFISNNYLKSKHNNNFKVYGYNDLATFKKKLNIIYFFMRIILKILGPIKFHNFSRLLIFLSSYRQNPEMWKSGCLKK